MQIFKRCMNMNKSGSSNLEIGSENWYSKKMQEQARAQSLYCTEGREKGRVYSTVLYIRSLSHIFSFRYFIMSEAFYVGSLAYV